MIIEAILSGDMHPWLGSLVGSRRTRAGGWPEAFADASGPGPTQSRDMGLSWRPAIRRRNPQSSVQHGPLAGRGRSHAVPGTQHI